MHSQELIEFEGIVNNSLTENPLPFYNVVLTNKQIGTYSIEKGKFRLILTLILKWE